MPNPNFPNNPGYNLYVGARYVPMFANPIEWNKTNSYEPLTVVTYQGNSFTSKTFVPANTDITNTTYWALTGNYNAQVEQYRQEVSGLNDKYNDIIKSLYDVTYFGVDNTGSTNTTATINELLSNDTLLNLYFPDGIYKISPITLSKNIIMSENAWLLYDGSGLDDFVSITGNNMYFSLNIDCNSKNPAKALKVTGNNNTFNKVKIKNLMYNNVQDVNAGLYCYGTNNFIDNYRASNFFQEGSGGNNSGPQALTLSGNNINAIINNAYFDNVVSGIVDNSTSEQNIINCVYGNNFKDNIIYVVNGGNIKVGNIIADTFDEALVVISDTGSTSAYVGNLIVSNGHNIVRTKTFKNIIIGNIIANGDLNNIFLISDNNNVGKKLIVDSISYTGGVLHNLSYMPSDRGEVDEINIGKMYVRCLFNQSAGDSLPSFIRFDCAKKFVLNSFTFEFVDNENTIDTGTRVMMQLNSNLDVNSYIGPINFRCYGGDALKDILFRITNAVQKNLKLLGGRFNSENTNAEYNGNGDNNQSFKRCISNIPTQGYWNAGDFLWNTGGTSVGFFCTESGTPGTWKTLNYS